MIAFELEGDKIRIEHVEDGTIRIERAGENVFEIPKDDSRKLSEIKVSGHRIGVQYKEFPSILGMLLWNSGFGIYVDGKPLEKTSSDPREALKYASYAFFLFAGISLLTFLVSQNPDEKLVALIFVPFMVLMGLITKKYPFLQRCLAL